MIDAGRYHERHIAGRRRDIGLIIAAVPGCGHKPRPLVFRRRTWLAMLVDSWDRGGASVHCARSLLSPRRSRGAPAAAGVTADTGRPGHLEDDPDPLNTAITAAERVVAEGASNAAVLRAILPALQTQGNSPRQSRPAQLRRRPGDRYRARHRAAPAFGLHPSARHRRSPLSSWTGSLRPGLLRSTPRRPDGRTPLGRARDRAKAVAHR